MKKLFFIFFVGFLFSCSSLKIQNESGCNIDKNEIRTIIKKSKIKKLRKVVITENYLDSLPKGKECVGLFQMRVEKWKDVKNSMNYVHIPMVVTNDKVFINTSKIYYPPTIFTDKIIEQKDIVSELIEIEDKLKNSFNEKQLEEIKHEYELGVMVYFTVRWL